MTDEAVARLADALHEHWPAGSGRTEAGAYADCTCGEVIWIDGDEPQQGDPVLSFTRHTVEASLAADPVLADALRTGLALARLVEALPEHWRHVEITWRADDVIVRPGDGTRWWIRPTAPAAIKAALAALEASGDH